MFFKSESSVLALTIDSEKSLDNCMMRLESSTNLRSCSLHFAVNNLPADKISVLADLLKQQIELDTLVLTAEASLAPCAIYATILGTIFTHLKHLRSLTFRGFDSFGSADALINLIHNTKTLSVLSVGYKKEKAQYFMSTVEKIDYFAEALKQNKSLTHLDIRNNLCEYAVEKILESLLTHTALKILKLSCPNADVLENEVIFEFRSRWNAIEEIHVGQFVKTPLKFECMFGSEEQVEDVRTYLLSTLTLKHLTLFSRCDGNRPNLESLALTINNLPHLETIKLDNLVPSRFKVFCEQGLIKHSNLREIHFTSLQSVDEESAHNLIQLIQHNTRLTSLTFQNARSSQEIWIGNNLASRLGSALAQNQNLIYFRLIGTMFRYPEIIADILAKNTCLKVLDLANNGFDFNANQVDTILDCLSKNKTLLTLNLCSNRIIFPAKLNKKINLLDFQLLRYPAGNVQSGVYFQMENKISSENYQAINEMVEENKQGLMILMFQKYLLLSHLGTQGHLLNTDVSDFIFKLILCTIESLETKVIGESIRQSIAIAPKVDNPPESNLSISFRN